MGIEVGVTPALVELTVGVGGSGEGEMERGEGGSEAELVTTAKIQC